MGKRVDLFSEKKKVKKATDDRAFDMMTAAADKTAVDFSFMQEMQEKRDIESILDAEFEKRDYGEQSAWFPTGKFLGKKVPRGVSGIVDALVFLAAGNVQNALKSTAKEEMVTLYRGVDKWFPGQMVKKGKFKGGGAHLTGKISGKTQGSKDYIRTSHSKAIGEDIADDAIWLTDLKDVAKNYSKMPPKGFEELYKRKGIKSGFLLEFEVPKSWIKKKGIPLYQSIESYKGNKKIVKEGLQYVFQEGVPKEFLKKVHK